MAPFTRPLMFGDLCLSRDVDFLSKLAVGLLCAGSCGGMLFDSGTWELLSAGFVGWPLLAFCFLGLIPLYGLLGDFLGLVIVDCFFGLVGTAGFFGLVVGL